MYCTKCGAELDENTKFCTSCGASTEKTSENIQTPTEPINVADNSQNQEKSNEKTFSIISLVSGIVGVICCCYLGVILNFIPAGLAIIFAFLSKKETNKFNGMAMSGLIMGITSIVLSILFLIVLIIYAIIEGIPV